jgi:hypothetical protein
MCVLTFRWSPIVHLYVLVLHYPSLGVVELNPFGVTGRSVALASGQTPIMAVVHALALVNDHAIEIVAMVAREGRLFNYLAAGVWLLVGT